MTYSKSLFKKIKKILLASFSLTTLHLTTANAQINTDLYMIYMNPFGVMDYEEEAIRSGYRKMEVPEFIKNENRMQFIESNIDSFNYSPGRERIKEALIQEAKIEDTKDLQLQIPAFFAYLDEKQVEILKNSEDVVSVEKMDMDPKHVTISAFSDLTINGEVIPWGRQAISAGDFNNFPTNLYVVDTAFSSSALSNEINFLYNNNSGIISDHSAAVLSLAAAKSNSSFIRGVNPGQKIVLFGTTLTQADLITQLTRIAVFAELNNEFSAMSLSINHGDESVLSDFGHNRPYGNALRRASGRLFIAQSAGNFNRNACLSAFNYNSIGYNSRDNDGIMVVGGTDQTGGRYQRTANPAPFDTENRSNYGPCVEVWAPGQLMTTTLSNGNLVTATGTSFAAPMVATLASRYGNNQMRPIEREARIKNDMVFTGKFEEAGAFNAPIYQVNWSNRPTNTIPKKLDVFSIYTGSSLMTNNLNKLIDSKFYEEISWNAGGNNGTIILDLGSIRNVRGIRIMIRSSANGGALNFAVHGGNSINTTNAQVASMLDNPIAFYNTIDQYDLVPYYIPLNSNYRYIKIDATNAASWLSYSEIEVYGL